MSRDDSSSDNNILSRPEHVLTFIKHALQSDTMQDAASSADPSPRQGLTMDDLRIVPEENPDDDSGTEGDSDDETPSLQGVRPNDEMTVTALNLLLSLLEGGQPYFQTSLEVSIIIHISESDPLLAVGPGS